GRVLSRQAVGDRRQRIAPIHDLLEASELLILRDRIELGDRTIEGRGVIRGQRLDLAEQLVRRRCSRRLRDCGKRKQPDRRKAGDKRANVAHEPTSSGAGIGRIRRSGATSPWATAIAYSTSSA